VRCLRMVATPPVGSPGELTQLLTGQLQGAWRRWGGVVPGTWFECEACAAHLCWVKVV
jgi:hypothetical protein